MRNICQILNSFLVLILFNKTSKKQRSRFDVILLQYQNLRDIESFPCSEERENDCFQWRYLEDTSQVYRDEHENDRRVEDDGREVTAMRSTMNYADTSNLMGSVAVRRDDGRLNDGKCC